MGATGEEIDCHLLEFVERLQNTLFRYYGSLCAGTNHFIDSATDPCGVIRRVNDEAKYENKALFRSNNFYVFEQRFPSCLAVTVRKKSKVVWI